MGTFKVFVADRDPGWKKFGSESVYPGSATLHGKKELKSTVSQDFCLQEFFYELIFPGTVFQIGDTSFFVFLKSRRY